MEKKKIGLIILDIIIVVILIIGIILIWKILENGNGRMYYRMDYAEVSVYNDKFIEYEGEIVKGTKVKGLIDTVQQHNLANQEDMSRWVIFTGSVDVKKIVKLQNLIDEPWKQTKKIKEQIINQDTYEVRCLYSKETGMIRAIYLVNNEGKLIDY